MGLSPELLPLMKAPVPWGTQGMTRISALNSQKIINYPGEVLTQAVELNIKDRGRVIEERLLTDSFAAFTPAARRVLEERLPSVADAFTKVAGGQAERVETTARGINGGNLVFDSSGEFSLWIVKNYPDGTFALDIPAGCPGEIGLPEKPIDLEETILREGVEECLILVDGKPILPSTGGGHTPNPDISVFLKTHYESAIKAGLSLTPAETTAVQRIVSGDFSDSIAMSSEIPERLQATLPIAMVEVSGRNQETTRAQGIFVSHIDGSDLLRPSRLPISIGDMTKVRILDLEVVGGEPLQRDHIWLSKNDLRHLLNGFETSAMVMRRSGPSEETISPQTYPFKSLGKAVAEMLTE